MDYKRVILFAALAFISVLLWDAWQEDYPAQPTKQQQTSAAKQEDAIGAPNGGNTRVQDVDQTMVFGDQPFAVNGRKVDADTSVPSQETIHVKTDTLAVEIDTQGGTVIGARLLQFDEDAKEPNVPFVLLNSSSEHYYVAQSGLVGTDDNISVGLSTPYKSEQKQYVLQPGQDQLVVDLKWRNEHGLDVIKRFTFKRGEYTIDVAYNVTNNTAKPWAGKLAMQLKRIDNPPPKSFFQVSAYFGAAISSPQDPYQKVSFKDMDKLMKKNKPLLDDSVKGGWVAMQQHYFLSAWVPDQDQLNYFYYLVSTNPRSSNAAGLYAIGVEGPEMKVNIGDSATFNATLYTGPEEAKILKTVAPNLDLTIDYGILWFLSVAIFWLMDKVYNFVGNWGWSIIIVTLFIKLLFYQLSAKAFISMAKYRKAITRIQPKMQALKDRYGDDRQKMSQAMMELYKREGINPLPLGGCLPILVQLPVFIALYWVLIESVQLRQAPFILWITDLSTKDPYYILPIIFGILMFLQQKLSPPPPDPMQAKVMMLFPVFLTVIFLNFPAGLVLYMITNTAVSVLQQWYFIRKYDKQDVKKIAKAK